MKRALGWLLLSAFSLGLSFDYPRALRTILGLCGVALGTIGLLFACDQGPAPTSADALRADVDRPDLHEALVAESFDRLSPTEAATVAGVLHHYCIGPTHGRFRVNALELHAAVDLVSRASGFDRRLLRCLYHDHWIELQGHPARRILRRLRQHELVRELYVYPEVGSLETRRFSG